MKAGFVLCLLGMDLQVAANQADSGPRLAPELKDGLPVSRDPSIAPEACRADPARCMATARAHWSENGWRDDRPGLLRAYAIACEFGISDACEFVAEQYLWGESVEKDAGRAVTLFERGCLQLKAATSCKKAGAFYARNVDRVFRQDYQKAVEFYMKGCDLGSAVACYEVALNHRLGRGVTKDLAKAKLFKQRARALGFRHPHEGASKAARGQ